MAKTGKENAEKDFVLSDGSKINSKGFRVDLSGGRFERFDSNPVMLYDHDTQLVIGLWENRRIEDGKMMAKPVFDMGDAVAAEKARKVNEGFLKGVSMGMIPYNMEKIGDDYVLTDWELVEASITPIPSDSGAVRLYNEKRETITFEQFKLSFNNQISNQMDKMTIVLTAVTLSSLGLSPDCSAKEIELAVAEKDKKITDLEKEIKGLKTGAIETFLSQAVKDGKITEKEKADYLELSQTSQSSFEKVKAIIDGKPATASVSLKDMTQKSNLTAGERASWTYLDWMQKDSKGLLKLKHENPTEFERLQTEFSQSKK